MSFNSESSFENRLETANFGESIISTTRKNLERLVSNNNCLKEVNLNLVKLRELQRETKETLGLLQQLGVVKISNYDDKKLLSNSTINQLHKLSITNEENYVPDISPVEISQ